MSGTRPVRRSREHPADLGGRQLGLVDVQQRVVGVLDLVGEAVGHAAAQLDVALQVRLEEREVRAAPGVDPHLRRLGARACDLRGQVAGHAARAAVVARRDAHERRRLVVVGAPSGPRRQLVEQRPQGRLGEAVVVQALHGGQDVAAGGAAARRHVRLLVPAQQVRRMTEVVELAQPRAQVVQALGPHGGQLRRRHARSLPAARSRCARRRRTPASAAGRAPCRRRSASR